VGEVDDVEFGRMADSLRDQDVARVEGAMRDAAFVHAPRSREQRREVRRCRAGQQVHQRHGALDLAGRQQLVPAMRAIAAVGPAQRLGTGDALAIQDVEQLEFALDAVRHEPAAQRVVQRAMAVELHDGAAAARERLGPDDRPGLRLDQPVVRRGAGRGHAGAPSLTMSA
jgi:hypothetical protein